VAAAVLLAAATSSFPQQGSPPLGDCIGSPNGVSWTAYDDHTVLARSDGRSFLVTTDKCPRLVKPLTHIVIETSGGGPICRPQDARLYASGPDRIPTPCLIQSIRPLTQDEARALKH
jgi:hypothetical protein